METLQSGMQGVAVASILTEHPFIHCLLVPEAQLCCVHHGQQVSVAVHTWSHNKYTMYIMASRWVSLYTPKVTTSTQCTPWPAGVCCCTHLKSQQIHNVHHGQQVCVAVHTWSHNKYTMYIMASRCVLLYTPEVTTNTQCTPWPAGVCCCTHLKSQVHDVHHGQQVCVAVHTWSHKYMMYIMASRWVLLYTPEVTTSTQCTSWPAGVTEYISITTQVWWVRTNLYNVVCRSVSGWYTRAPPTQAVHL